ncbi:MAG: Unknown protein [uncultured Campylobacterales bacterium]|uniref:Uncharacterized protein n=1 Tax=uncultured Campylobacterales bacterium TaxID=352960 RepID=A0A6S6T249_9BACT|nr:MAG: Unknown protein [uncultured Campylobacterales bacterium]
MLTAQYSIHSDKNKFIISDVDDYDNFIYYEDENINETKSFVNTVLQKYPNTTKIVYKVYYTSSSIDTLIYEDGEFLFKRIKKNDSSYASYRYNRDKHYFLQDGSFFTKLQDKIKTSEDELIKYLEYKNIKKAKSRIDRIYSSNTLKEFLDDDCYDLVHSSKSFLYKSSYFLELPIHYLEDELKEYDRAKNIESIKPPTITIETNFKRGGQNLMTLGALARNKTITLDKEEALNSGDNGIEIARKFIKNHYEKSGGNLKFWGEITKYVYRFRSVDLIFDVKDFKNEK